MTPEEVLESKDVKYWDWLRMKGTTPSVYNAIIEVMDEYAKQEAISLLRYWNYECVGYPIEDGDEQKFEETYNDYLQSKNQKP